MQSMRKQIRKRARQRKRTRDLSLLSRAEDAANNGDSKALFQCVKLLSGSKTTGKLRLRDDQEGLLPACQVLTRYAGDLFTGPVFSPPDLQHFQRTGLMQSSG